MSNVSVESEAATLASALTSFLATKLSAADPEITALHRSGAGSSRENWPFDATWTDDLGRRNHKLLLRRDPPSAVVNTARSVEFELLQRLPNTEIPAVEVLWLDDGTRLLRPSMIVRRYSGRADRAVFRRQDPLGLGTSNQYALAASLCDTLSLVHGLDVDACGIAPLFEDPGTSPARYELDRWLAELDRVALAPQPELLLAAGWLADHLPAPPSRIVLVHGDFQPANILIGDGGTVSAVLDWELAHLGDPLDDLGWYTAPLYRTEHFNSRWRPNDIVDRYARSSGRAVDPAELTFWQVLSTFRLAVMALAGVRNFCDGTTDRPAAPPTQPLRRLLRDILDAEQR